MAKDYERINVLFPKEVARELRKTIPEGERSQFVVEATRKELRRKQLRKALNEGAGIWKDEDYPHLKTVEDIHRWLEEFRRPGEERLSKLRRR